MAASLSNIVDVNVSVTSQSTISSNFNLAMMPTTSVLSIDEVRYYNASNYQKQMVEDGFSTSGPEYIKAGIFFSQNPRGTRLAVAGMDGDPSILADELARIRSLDDSFYILFFADELDATEIETVAAFVETSAIPTLYIFADNNSNDITKNTTNIFNTLKTNKYTRSFGFYTTDEFTVSSTDYFKVDAAVAGLLSGLNSMEDNSAYTAAYKTLVGTTPEDLSDSEVEILLGYSGNAYLKFGSAYSFVYPCISGGDYHIDDIYLVDVSKILIQQYVVAGLTSQLKVPQTESGVNMIVNMISNACRKIGDIGLIAGGIWRGDAVGSLNSGDAIENGYYIEAGSIADQDATDIKDRKSPTILVALLSSGAIEHVVINVYVSR